MEGSLREVSEGGLCGFISSVFLHRHLYYISSLGCRCGKTRDKQPTHTDRREPTAGKSHHGPKAGSCVRRKPNLSEASVRLGHKSLRTLMKRSSSWYLPGGYQGPLHPSSSQSLRPNGSCFPRGQSDELVFCPFLLMSFLGVLKE